MRRLPKASFTESPRHSSVSVLDDFTVPPAINGLTTSTSDSVRDDSFNDSAGSMGYPRGSERRDFSRLKPVAMRPGERTVSTSIRLRRQGFTMSKSGLSNFAVKSIRRGSDEWNGLLRPFVSDLVFRSLEYRWSQSEVSFRPYSCQAAVLFVDLSNYSKITAELGQRGVHSISTVVNAYLGRLLNIVSRYGGDVAKFAGDAVLVVWEGNEQELEINLITAAQCAMDLQENAGTHEIEGASFEFRIHCGLCFGPLESEIFAAPNHVNMQRLYHSVGGESLKELSELVEIAKAGEICISESCLQYIGDFGSYRKVDDTSSCLLLTAFNLDDVTVDRMEGHLEQVLSDRLLRRNQKIEEDFIHPSVIRLLSHGGLSPTQIAQMRNLCVLFIAMTSNGSSVNWLMEVQSILDKNRCPSTYASTLASDCDVSMSFSHVLARVSRPNY
jgi:class 3 adenylate cyclase